MLIQSKKGDVSLRKETCFLPTQGLGYRVLGYRVQGTGYKVENTKDSIFLFLLKDVPKKWVDKIRDTRIFEG